MTIAFVVLGSAVVLGLTAAFWWWRTSPGRRLRCGAFTLYYTEAVTAEVANRVAQHLMREHFMDQPMDARLIREGATYQLQLISSGQPGEKQVMACEVLAAGLSDDVFAGAAVEVQICDTIFRPMSVIPHRGRFGRRITMNAAHLFYRDGVSDSEALEVATFLAGVGVFDDSPKIAQLSRSAEGYEFRLAVEVNPLTPEMVEGERRMANDLAQVLRGAPVAVRFGNGLLGTLSATEHGTANCHVPGGPYRSKIFQVPAKPADEKNRREQEER